MTVYIILKRMYDVWVPTGVGFYHEYKAADYCRQDIKLDYKPITIEDAIVIDFAR